MTTITLGRRPTLGEVVDYYTREPFLRYLLDTVQRRRVVLIISKRKHWEPNWASDEVIGQDIVSLRRFILRKVKWYLPGINGDERPDFYPAFHQSVWRGRGDDEALGPTQHMDCIFEADLPTWHDAFQDVSAITSLFERYGVPYQHKFSGHRSLHIVIPGEVLPQGYRGKATRKLAGKLLQWGGSQAHHLPKITRMPYSLNEDTGLACLPIERGELPSFRPWQANLHLVDVPGTCWDVEIDENDQERMAKLVSDLETERAEQPGDLPKPERSTFIIETPQSILARYRDRLNGLKGSGTVGRAWAQLAGSAAVAVPTLIEGLSQDDPDTRWLSAEAYVFHGTGITPEAFGALLAQDEEYTQASATDALLRFEDTIRPWVAEAIGSLGAYSSVGAHAAYLLTQSPRLRQGVFATLMGSAGRTDEARITVGMLDRGRKRRLGSGDATCRAGEGKSRALAAGTRRPSTETEGLGDHGHTRRMEQGGRSRESSKARSLGPRHHRSPVDRHEQPEPAIPSCDRGCACSPRRSTCYRSTDPCTKRRLHQSQTEGHHGPGAHR